jgi:inner membrane protein involved in colicin E2 resistance
VALFALLAAVMIGTRKVNWYAIAATGVRQAP